MDSLWPALAALVPSIGVGLLFWFAMRAVIRADRNERLAVARMEAEEDARDAAVSKDAS
ncbi:hypothetical protein SAMN04489860_0939 [Paraoerskovia marina]|uniref:Uncharacterized protein n=1 Tax=Paraoerskovia marina TaxID=545619 RepID=A0A1H1PYP6_9CELL|nr:hypothetical protein [Paraoerskovia marina]SDS16290.1 hypothetical protein SAMN04489860_0939 [Paraoerskovia marina]